MDSKKKMIIAITSFAIVLLATVVAVVAVLAAQNVNVTSTVNVSYTAGANVMGSISGSYKTENNATKDLTAKSFNGNETGTPTESLGDFGTVAFTQGTNDYIEFTFSFTNSSTVADYVATLSFTNGATGAGTVSNMKLYSKTSAEGSYSEITSPTLNNLGSVTVVKNNGTNNGTGVFMLKVELKESTADASFNGTFKWDLTASR